MNFCDVAIGDWVRPAESSDAITGKVIAVREGAYLIVEWPKGVRSTHRCGSLKFVMRRLDGRERPSTSVKPDAKALWMGQGNPN